MWKAICRVIQRFSGAKTDDVDKCWWWGCFRVMLQVGNPSIRHHFCAEHSGDKKGAVL